MSERIIQQAKERDEFVVLADGFVYYWPSGAFGALAARNLRVIADELDRRNDSWNQQIEQYFDERRQVT